jgi:hypothetical protein
MEKSIASWILESMGQGWMKLVLSVVASFVQGRSVVVVAP